MAKRDVVKYYRDTIDQYVKLSNTLSELQKALEEGHVKESQVESFIPLIEAAKAHMEEMSYVIFLLKQPALHPKKFFTKNNDLIEAFKNRKLDRDSHLNTTQELLDKMRELLVDKEEDVECN